MNERFIPLSVPNLKGNELKYVTDAIQTEWVSTAGKYVELFERGIAEYVGTEGAVACQSGTAGLHVALLVLGITDNDAVFAPALTFIAAVNPIKYVGAKPIFMDCDKSLCIDPVKLEEYCSKECNFIEGKLIDRSTGRHIKAVIVVHVFGNMADMEKILEIAHQYNLRVIEDATEALGTCYISGKYEKKFAGTLGDIGVYSFNGNKIITTGGGGMLVSANQEYLINAKHITTQAKSEELYYTHDVVGYNYRMTNVQAAIGLAQLELLEDFIRKKEKNYLYYKKRIAEINGLELLCFREATRSNHWFYGINCAEFQADRDTVIVELGKNKIQTRPIWGLICDQKPYVKDQKYHIDQALYYWKNIVNVPCSTNLTYEQIDTVIECLLEISRR